MNTEPIHSEMQLGPVALATANLATLSDFYQQVIGLELNRRSETTIHLGVHGRDLVLLEDQPGAKPPAPRSTGLYHLAILVPSRLELARFLRRLAASGWPAQGFANHGVSEAIYLADPDGNGIEIYRDYPREQWPMRNGQLQMVTEALDLEAVLAELKGEAMQRNGPLHPDTRLGHVHLRVADIPAAQDFYCRILGFDLVQRYGPSALFVSAGGYHHHIGLNTWQSAGGPPPQPEAAGLRYFTILLPEETELRRLSERLRGEGIAVEKIAGGLLAHDPAHNGVLLATV